MSWPQRIFGPQVFHCARADVGVAFADAAGGRHQEREREVRGRLGEDAGGVADRNAALRRLGDVAVVEADREVRDDLQLRRRVEQLGVDLLGQQAEETVDVLDLLEENVARRRQVARPDLDLALLLQQVKTLVVDSRE